MLVAAEYAVLPDAAIPAVLVAELETVFFTSLSEAGAELTTIRFVKTEREETVG